MHSCSLLVNLLSWPGLTSCDVTTGLILVQPSAYSSHAENDLLLRPIVSVSMYNFDRSMHTARYSCGSFAGLQPYVVKCHFSICCTLWVNKLLQD